MALRMPPAEMVLRLYKHGNHQCTSEAAIHVVQLYTASAVRARHVRAVSNSVLH
jgi:hypothetical protein